MFFLNEDRMYRRECPQDETTPVIKKEHFPVNQESRRIISLTLVIFGTLPFWHLKRKQARTTP